MPASPATVHTTDDQLCAVKAAMATAAKIHHWKIPPVEPIDEDAEWETVNRVRIKFAQPVGYTTCFGGRDACR